MYSTKDIYYLLNSYKFWDWFHEAFLFSSFADDDGSEETLAKIEELIEEAIEFNKD